jgi:hypothetical protein
MVEEEEEEGYKIKYNSLIGPLQKQKKQRQAKYQMGRLFQQTSGTKLTQSGERQKWLESVGKPVEKKQRTMIYEKISERS